MTTRNKGSIINMARIFSLHHLPKHLKVQLWRIYKKKQRKKLLDPYAAAQAFINLHEPTKVTAKELQCLANAYCKTKPTKQRSKKPRQWVNKFYSRQA